MWADITQYLPSLREIRGNVADITQSLSYLREISGNVARYNTVALISEGDKW